MSWHPASDADLPLVGPPHPALPGRRPGSPADAGRDRPARGAPRDVRAGADESSTSTVSLHRALSLWSGGAAVDPHRWTGSAASSHLDLRRDAVTRRRRRAGRLTAGGGRRREPWDLLVIGGGTAGIVGRQDRRPARCAGAPGGTRPDRWRLPVDRLRAVQGAPGGRGRRRPGAPAGRRFGVEVAGVDVDFARVMAHVRSAIAHIAPVDSVEALEEAGVSVLHGSARFTSPRTAEIHAPADRRSHGAFRQALLATGAAPAVPPSPGCATSTT